MKTLAVLLLIASLPSVQQIRWAEAEVGVIIHFDINVISPGNFDYARRETLPPAAAFNPSRLNTDQWLQCAHGAGARYAVLVAKHGTGFCLWPTRAHPYHVGRAPWRDGRGDIVRDFIASCRKFGIRPGLYYNTNINTYLGAGPAGVRSGRERAEYNRIVLEQLAELWTQYGPLFEIWFDGGVAEDSSGGIAREVRALLGRHQRDAVLFQGPPGMAGLIRWTGNEDARAPLPGWSSADLLHSPTGIFAVADPGGSPEGSTWCPAEADVPGRRQSAWNGGWLWRAGEDHEVFTAPELVERYYTSVGRNANMLIGMAIDSAGLCPGADSAALAGFGARIREIFSAPLASTAGRGDEIGLAIGPPPRAVNQVVLGEEISSGERIRRFEVQARLGGRWMTVAAGACMGHKFIRRFSAVRTDALRLLVHEESGEPRVREFSAYNVR